MQILVIDKGKKKFSLRLPTAMLNSWIFAKIVTAGINKDKKEEKDDNINVDKNDRKIAVVINDDNININFDKEKPQQNTPKKKVSYKTIRKIQKTLYKGVITYKKKYGKLVLVDVEDKKGSIVKIIL